MVEGKIEIDWICLSGIRQSIDSHNDSRVRVSSAALIGFVYQFITCQLGRERDDRAIPTLGTFKLCLSHCTTRVVKAYAEMKKWTSASHKASQISTSSVAEWKRGYFIWTRSGNLSVTTFELKRNLPDKLVKFYWKITFSIHLEHLWHHKKFVFVRPCADSKCQMCWLGVWARKNNPFSCSQSKVDGPFRHLLFQLDVHPVRWSDRSCCFPRKSSYDEVICDRRVEAWPTQAERFSFYGNEKNCQQNLGESPSQNVKCQNNYNANLKLLLVQAKLTYDIFAQKVLAGVRTIW